MHESAARSDFLDQLAELIVYPIERCLCVSFNQAAGETVLPSGEWKYKKNYMGNNNKNDQFTVPQATATRTWYSGESTD